MTPKREHLTRPQRLVLWKILMGVEDIHAHKPHILARLYDKGMIAYKSPAGWPPGDYGGALGGAVIITERGRRNL